MCASVPVRLKSNGEWYNGPASPLWSTPLDMGVVRRGRMSQRNLRDWIWILELGFLGDIRPNIIDST
jgi:hypothetical protein